MRSALVIGASRGIGRQIALTLSQNGYGVTVAAKTAESSAKLPGSIYTVAKEIEGEGGKAIPVLCNARKEEDIRSAVRKTIDKFGQVDVAVYNAGAIFWKKILDTPLKQFDLLMDVNVRGAYTMIQELLPHFLDRQSGKIVLVAPPIYNRFIKGKAPYSVSKIGMTILAKGLASEISGTGVSICTLWPATAIKAHVTNVENVPDRVMRKPTIFADAVLKIVQEDSDRLNGQVLIDEDYLRSVGETDFSRYRCDPDHEPPRMMPKQFPDLTVAEENEISPPSKL